MRIRRVTAEELPTASFPLRRYAFEPSPMTPEETARSNAFAPWCAEDVTLVAEEDGEFLATVTGLPMRQNLRGVVHPMAGVAGVASHPATRRRGHVRTLLTRLLGDMRDDGSLVSALYPFRPSFYGRLGFVGLPAERTVTFAPEGLRPLLTADLPGEVTWQRIGDDHAAYRSFTRRLLAERHGFSAFPEKREARRWDRNDEWLATARVDGEVVGASTYRITEHAGELAGELLYTEPVGRALLLRFLAGHVDQVTRIKLTISADERPELWATDLSTHTEARISYPETVAPMARLLDMTALDGLATGPGQVRVEVVDDPFVGGSWLLDSDGGTLAVTPVAAGGGTVPAATLTAAGLSALAYGALDPLEVVLRGFGQVPTEAVGPLRAIFPPVTPYLHAHF